MTRNGTVVNTYFIKTFYIFVVDIIAVCCMMVHIITNKLLTMKKFNFKYITHDNRSFNMKISVGHFYVSGFASKGDKHVYFSIQDVRHFNNEWYNHILVRTARDTKDYHGGSNNYTTLPQLRQAVETLMNGYGKGLIAW